MKKTLILAGVLGAFAMSAHAQSSVTLYGSLDAGILYANNAGGHSTWNQSSSGMSYTYFGLKGSEDLGGGLKAIFKLESGFDINNGGFYNGQSMFNRQAYVGLKSDQYGTVTLGRQYDSVVDYLSPLSAAGQGYGNNLAAHPFDNDNLDESFSINNAVKYQSANYSGFQFGGQYGFSNQAGNFSNGRAWSVGASYGNGPLNFAAGYSQLNNSGGLNNSTGAAAANDTNIAAALQRGGFSAGGMTGLNLHLDNYELNGAYHLTPALALTGAYTFTDGTVTGAGNQSPKWQTVMLGTDYSLSKRTDVYLAGVYQHASGSLGIDPTTGAAVQNVAAINSLAPSSTENQVAATVGLRHRF
jgi:general bacterial porin, GBP family